MTCIIGITEKNKVWMGSDSRITYGGGGYATKATPKTFKHGELLIGCAGSLRVQQIIQHNSFLAATAIPEEVNLYSYLFEFAEKLRESLKSLGVSMSSDDGEHMVKNSGILIGGRGKLYELYSDYALIEVGGSFMAIGSGYAYSLGSLRNSKDKTPETRIKEALETCSEFNGTVGPPFNILCI